MIFLSFVWGVDGIVEGRMFSTVLKFFIYIFYLLFHLLLLNPFLFLSCLKVIKKTKANQRPIELSLLSMFFIGFDLLCPFVEYSLGLLNDESIVLVRWYFSFVYRVQLVYHMLNLEFILLSYLINFLLIVH